MKRKKDYTIELLLFILLIAILFSCRESKIVTGTVTAVNGDTITVQGHTFKVYGNIPAVGNTATFIETRNRKKVNAKKVN